MCFRVRVASSFIFSRKYLLNKQLDGYGILALAISHPTLWQYSEYPNAVN